MSTLSGFAKRFRGKPVKPSNALQRMWDEITRRAEEEAAKRFKVKWLDDTSKPLTDEDRESGIYA